MQQTLTAIALIVLGHFFNAPTCVSQDAKILSEAEAMTRYRNLKAFYAAYWAHHLENWNKAGREAPRSWEDLAAAGLKPDVRTYLENNGFKVVLGIKYYGLKNGTSEVMLAYPIKTVSLGPQGFGYIAVFMDGHVGSMTEDEFKESRKILEPYLKDAIVLPESKIAR